MRIILLAIVSLIASKASHAADCNQSIWHFQHTSWTLTDGAPPDVWALAQSPDGYLWLGTGAGLFRFDGVKFERIKALAGAAFPTVDITALLAMPSGDLWIGYQNGGVSLLSGGRLTNFNDGVPKGPVHKFVEDQDHAVWMLSDHGLGRFSNGRWQEIGSDWSFPGHSGNDLFVARDGTLWVTISWGKPFHQDASVLVFLRRGSDHFETIDKPVTVAAAVAQAPDGRMWVSDQTQGARELDSIPGGGASKEDASGHPPAWSLRPFSLLFDDEGGIWGIHHLGGIFRLQLEPQCAGNGAAPNSRRMDPFGSKDGLTSDISASLLKDREGNIWVGSNLGLDRFRRANVVAETRTLTAAPEGYRATRGADGSVYVASGRSLVRIDSHGSAHPLFSSPAPVVFLRTSKDGETIWLGTQSHLLRLRQGQWTQVALPKVPGSSDVWKFEEDARGVCWLAMYREGIFRLEDGVWKKFETASQLDHLAPMLMTTDFQGRKWLYYSGGPLALVENSRVRIFSAADGPGIGDIQVMLATPSGMLLAGEFGVGSFDGERFHALRSSSIPSLSRITGIVQSSAGETWMNGIMGIVRVKTKELDAALADPTLASSLSYQLFDFRDGLPGLAQQDSFEPTAIETSDHRLWFITNHGLAWIDPAHITRNSLPPPVVIRSLTAGGVQYADQPSLTFHKHIAGLQIDYTALSLSIPERVRFRYMLQGVDSNWIDPSGRRQAFYTDLGPGKYRFQVIASNNDGVWNEAGASIGFTILPAWYQTRWFYALCALAALGAVAGFYQARLAQARRLIGARLSERERIARELHDSLLQGFQGLMFRLWAIRDLLPNRPAEAAAALETALGRGEETITDAREAVQDLRTSSLVSSSLERAMRALGEELASGQTSFRVVVEGRPRELAPLVRDDSYRIAREAFRNAAAHSNARNIEAEIEYGDTSFSLRVRDDGEGIDRDVLVGGRRPGHWGLQGMRERAQQLGGQLNVWSERRAGTEVELVIPAAIAYGSTRNQQATDNQVTP